MLDSLVVKERAAEFISDSNKVIRFQQIRNPDDVVPIGQQPKEESNERVFPPEMTHQIYGETENIFGYRNLHVDILFSSATLNFFIDVKSDETINEEDLVADPIVPPLMKLMAPEQVSKTMDDFLSIVREKDPKFTPFGEKIHEFTSSDKRSFEVYYCDGKVPGFLDYHSKLQVFIMFFIDAASYIDVDDNWRFFLLFEKYELNGNTQYSLAGYTTVYQYYAYPSNMRPRISQMLVLPTYQRKGVGAELLNSVQRYYWNNDNVIDITVEDPSDEFIRLRDFVDSKNCLTLEAFNESNLREQGYNPKLYKACNEAFKLCKKQSRRVFEILRLKYTKIDNAKDYDLYKSIIEKRLNQPFEKEAIQLEKWKKCLSQAELAAAAVKITQNEERLNTIEAQFKDLEEHYLQIVTRLNKL